MMLCFILLILRPWLPWVGVVWNILFKMVLPPNGPEKWTQQVWEKHYRCLLECWISTLTVYPVLQVQHIKYYTGRKILYIYQAFSGWENQPSINFNPASPLAGFCWSSHQVSHVVASWWWGCEWEVDRAEMRQIYLVHVLLPFLPHPPPLPRPPLFKTRSSFCSFLFFE